jgi:flagellar export protein FliJ
VKRFRFRLEQVLRVRRLQEDRARAALLAANRDAHEAAVRVEAALAEYQTRSFPGGVQTYEAFERALFLLDTAASSVELERRAYREALVVVDERRNEWMDARRRVHALERLEERRRAEHELDNRRAEDRLVDDLVVARHAGGTR